MFHNVDESFVINNALVMGVIGSKGVMESNGKPYDSTKCFVYTNLTGERKLGGSVVIYKYGTVENCDFLASKGFIFPAVCDLKIKKTSSGLDKENDEIIELKYIGPVEVKMVTAATEGSPAAQPKKVA
jgi:hypothetical protein